MSFDSHRDKLMDISFSFVRNNDFIIFQDGWMQSIEKDTILSISLILFCINIGYSIFCSKTTNEFSKHVWFYIFLEKL